MAKIFTDGKDQIAGGVVYRSDKFGYAEVPDDVAQDELLVEVPKAKPKPRKAPATPLVEED